ncbi:MAG: DUF805 domain-containing protein [Xanthobacteraceae bacterium]
MTIDWAYLFNTFEGRIGRQTFWIGIIVLLVAETFAHVLAEEIQGDRLSAIVDLAYAYPEFALCLKRAHDRNLPLWLLISFFCASALLDFLTVLELTGPDDQPSLLSVAIAVPFTVLGLVLLVELGVRRGTIGPNPYGADPLGPQAPRR